MGQTVSYLPFTSTEDEVDIAPEADYLQELFQSGWNDGIQSKRVLCWLSNGNRRWTNTVSMGNREIGSLPDGGADGSSSNP